MPHSHKIIYLIYIVIWAITAINPKYPEDWMLENVLPIIFFPILIWLDRKYRLSLTALILLLIFSTLHAIGAHYTYAQMPWFETISKIFGFERNNYDRVVHFLFGLLVYLPIFEILRHFIQNIKVALWVTFSIIVSISALYEILEWLAVMIFHPELGMAFLGTQNDVWDAQKDMLVADIGAMINIFWYYIYSSFNKKS